MAEHNTSAGPFVDFAHKCGGILFGISSRVSGEILIEYLSIYKKTMMCSYFTDEKVSNVIKS